MHTSRFTRSVLHLVLLLFGCFIIALSFNLLHNPNAIASGGIPGLSTVVEEWIGWPPAYIQWSANAALLVIGAVFLGRAFALKSVLGSMTLPFFIYITSDWAAWTTNPLLASIYGGIGTGLGLGLIFRSGGSVGGFTVIAQLLHRMIHINLSTAVAGLDFLVIAGAGIVFSPEHALYAFAGLFMMKKTLQMLQEGIDHSKVVFIISEQAETISHAILQQLDRGVTKLPGIGGYSDNECTVLFVVCEQEELMELKKLVKSVDTRAFMTITEAKEVSGEGFNQFLVDRQRLTPRLHWRKWSKTEL